MTKKYKKLTHALIHANRLYQDWATYRPKKRGTNQRYIYVFRKLVKYFNDRKIEYWHWGSCICYKYQGQVVWIHPPKDKYTKIYLPYKNLEIDFPAWRMDQIVKKLKEKGLLPQLL